MKKFFLLNFKFMVIKSLDPIKICLETNAYPQPGSNLELMTFSSFILRIKNWMT